MENNTKVVLASVFIAVVLSLITCDKKDKNKIVEKVLEPNEKQAVIVERGVVTILKRVKKGLEGKQEGIIKQQIVGARELRISSDENGEIIVLAKTRGFCFIPGIVLSKPPRGPAQIGLGMEIAYWKNFGALVGLTSTPEVDVSMFAGVGYRLPWKLTRNTGVFVSYDTRKNINIGMRIEL